jgi:SAM-dependent methyltransferase
MSSDKKPPSYPGWHRVAVAGKTALKDDVWESLGRMQLDFLIEQGLKPSDNFLEVGCGALRSGIHLIRYLDHHRYYGVDKEAALIDAGVQVELPKAGLRDVKATFGVSPDFDLSFVPNDVSIDVAWSMAVFIHIGPDLVEKAISRVLDRLRSGGRFFATFHVSNDGKVHKSRPLDNHNAWRKNEQWSVEYPFEALREMASRASGEAEYIGAWGHPANNRKRQMMALFTKQ